MSLIHWWPLNGNLKDYGTHNIPLTITNAPSTQYVNGKIGQCYNFNGAAWALASGVTVGTNCSVCCWAKTSVAGAMFWGMQCTGSDYMNLYNCGPICLNIGDSAENPFKDGSTAVPATSDGQWHNYVVVFKGSEKAKIYIDGVYRGQALTYRNPTMNSKNFTIGTWNYSGHGYYWNGGINDVRIYDQALSIKEIKEISKGLVLHYTFEDTYAEGTTNIGGTSSNYSNMNKGVAYNCSAWGGDSGTVTFYASGGYENAPYKVYHKTTTGSGGIYYKTSNDIQIESGKTYTVSVYVKASRNFTDSHYSFNINRGSDNYYITSGQSIVFTTEWTRVSWTFTATASQAGSYGEMSIVYEDSVADYYVYYSGFQVEVKDHATPYVNGTRQPGPIYDSSGYGYNGTQDGNLQIIKESINGNHCAHFNGESTKITSPFKCQYFGNDFTISAWLKSNVNNGGYLTAIGNEVYTGGIVFAELTTTNLLECYLSAVNGTDTNICTYTPFAANTWYHVVYSVKNALSSPDAKMYINGELVSNKIGNSPFGEPDEMLYIGCNKNYRYWNGDIADVKIYATALSAEDILLEYNRKASIDKNGNLFTGEIVENSQDEELLPGTQIGPNAIFDMHGYGGTEINTSDGSLQITGREWLSTNMIPVVQGDTYYYEMIYSNVTNNLLYVGLERFDEDNVSGSNELCVYYYSGGDSSARDHRRVFGSFTMSGTSSAGKPLVKVRLRILNNWNSASGNMIATIHNLSLRHVSSIQPQKVEKNGVVSTNVFREDTYYGKTSFYKNDVISSTNIKEE